MTKLFRLPDLKNAELNEADVKIILTFKQVEACCNNSQIKNKKFRFLRYLFCVESIKDGQQFGCSKKFLMPQPKPNKGVIK